MGYDLKPIKRDTEDFHFGAWSWPVLVEACGYLFACVSIGARYCYQPDADERFKAGPTLITNDGIKITATEAKLMARVARNFVAIQRGLPDDSDAPKKIRTDFVDRFEAFAGWAEKSGGFRIW